MLILLTSLRITMINRLILRAWMLWIRQFSGDFVQAKMSSTALGARLLKVHHTFTAEPMKYLKMETFLSSIFLGFHSEQVEKSKVTFLLKMYF